MNGWTRRIPQCGTLLLSALCLLPGRTADAAGDVRCPADFNGDGIGPAPDLTFFLSMWGPCPDLPDECPADLNDDGTVSFLDLRIVLTEWGPCPENCCENGKLRVLTMRYTGDGCDATFTTQDPDKVSCEGDPMFAPEVFIRATDKENPDDTSGRIWFEGNVALNDTFDINALNAGEDHLTSSTFIHIFSMAGDEGELLQTVEFHTSCSQDLFVGDQFGASRVVDCIGEDEPIEGDCCENGKPRVLTMEYTGEGCDATSHFQDPGKVSCEGDPMFAREVFIRSTDKENPDDTGGKIWFEGNVMLNETFDIDATNGGDDHLPSATFIHIFDLGGDLLQTVEFHTSCSQPLIIGNQFGASKLVDCIAENEPIEGDCCENGKPVILTMEYTADDCTATSHGQDAGKVACDDFGPLPATVRILSTDKDNPDATDARVWFDGIVSTGETFNISAFNAGATRLENETFIYVFDENDDVLLQSAEFHTSCSQPLFVGNQFGASLLVSCLGEDELFSCDGRIQELSMIWDGGEPVRIKAYAGNVGSDLVADIDFINPGDEVTVGGLGGAPNDVFWEVFAAGTDIKLGESKFHLSCSDSEMNGPEDCGEPQGNGKGNEADLINEWRLSGLVDDVNVLDCDALPF